MNATNTEKKSVETLRAEFATLQRNGSYDVGQETWFQACRETLDKMLMEGEQPTPELWVEAAEKTTVKCPACRGSGIYQWGAYDLLKKTMQHSGPCFRCLRKGYQTQEDAKRNYGYDNHRRVF